MNHLNKVILFVSLLFALPYFVSAHQPRVVSENEILVSDPQISKAYYGKLEGDPHIYSISSDKEFELYVNILVPDISGQKKDVSAVVLTPGKEDVPIALLEGGEFGWTRFFEEYGQDWYWQGPEYKATVPAGTYEIRVWSSNNDSKYSLAVGDIESFDFKESMNALYLVPRIKRDFFNESPANFIFSPIGAGYVFTMFVFAFIFGILYRLIALKLKKENVLARPRNIGKGDRLLRAFFGIALLALAITTTWNPFVLFFSGFCFFEAFASWCAFYQAIGRNTCPI